MRHVFVTNIKQMKRTPTLKYGVLFVQLPPYSLNCEKIFTSLCYEDIYLSIYIYIYIFYLFIYLFIYLFAPVIGMFLLLK